MQPQSIEETAYMQINHSPESLSCTAALPLTLLPQKYKYLLNVCADD